MSAIPINQLARPKNTKYECEVCGKPAALKCSECPTYYCTQEHFDVDWRGIRHLIAGDIMVLRERPKMIGSEEEREKRAKELEDIRKELLDLCTETAQKHLVQAKYELAVPGALQSLKLAIEVYGSEATELVPSYLLLAEANLGLRRLKIAEEFLSLANWNILKHPQAGSSMMSNLQRNFGRLYAAQQRYNEALQAFATDIYHSSLEFGPENIRSAPSYFHMGRVFQSHQKSDRASSFYAKVVDIYTSFLEDWLNADGQPGLGESFEITAVEVEEAIEIIKHIIDYRDKRDEDEKTERSHTETAEGRYTLGLLFVFTNDLAGGKECLVQASEIFKSTLGVDHQTSKKSEVQLDRVEERMQREALAKESLGN
jgi:tetratricopeptide (TPR) repeat protein